MSDGLTDHKLEMLTIAVKDLTETIRHFDERMAETYVRKDVMEPRVKSLEKSREWLLYLIMGGVVTALLTLVLNGGVLA